MTRRQDRFDYMAAARRGLDWSMAMDGEGEPAAATAAEAAYWLEVYTEIVAMETKVLQRVKDLMAEQSVEVRREVELTNLPIIAGHVERFRRRLGYWQERSRQLE